MGTPPIRQETATPDWVMAEVQEFIPHQFDTTSQSQLVGLPNGWSEWNVPRSCELTKNLVIRPATTLVWRRRPRTRHSTLTLQDNPIHTTTALHSVVLLSSRVRLPFSNP